MPSRAGQAGPLRGLRARTGGLWPPARLCAAVAVAGSILAGCVAPLESGEWGTFRYFADVPGIKPLRLLPPISDRAGNVYVLFGAPDRAEAAAYVGHENGGWSSGCTEHKGDSRGVHGWVGHVESKAWYWSGDSLVAISGANGSCSKVLDRDPSSQAELLFEAVFPWVRDTPSKTTLPALLRAPSDPRPYQAVVDLGLGRYSNATEFSPNDAVDVRVAGVGALPSKGEAFLLVSWTGGGGEPHTEGRFLDANANTLASSAISGNVLLERDSVQGYLQANDDGLVAGLLKTNELVLFDRTQARRRSIGGGMLPIGVHRYKGSLWLVGIKSGQPMIAPITADGAGVPILWMASERAAAHLTAPIEVLDDRSTPSTRVDWDEPGSAIGTFPFLHAHNPDSYTHDSTGWLVAGPSYQTGIEGMTSVAFSAVGISYP